jgi:hypothetical protein
LGVAIGTGPALCAEEKGAYRLAMFSADVTAPIGHAMMGGGIKPAERVDDPLEMHGIVLLGTDKPIVIAAIDWCEIRNDAYDRWRDALAEAAGTDRQRVVFSSIHQHDAPVADLTAQRLLDQHGLDKALCDLMYHEQCVQRAAKALRESLGQAKRITHVGAGQGKAEKVTSNRRIVAADGSVSFSRGSATGDPKLRAEPPGTIDPWLKTVSFWDGETPVAALHCFAVHPMSYYGRGGISADFVGMARRKRQADDPNIKQIYFSGCSGDVTVGKYNDGDTANRPILAERLYQAMVAAWKDTNRSPIDGIGFRSVPLQLEPKHSAGFSEEEMKKQLADTSGKTFDRILAAMGLSWRQRVATGQPIDVPVVDFGAAQILLMPAESFVGYQLMAQAIRPESFVMTIGYGECGPGYIPTDAASEERFNVTHSWCWVAPRAEAPMLAAMRKALLGE